MAKNNNGFQDIADYTGTLLRVDPEQIAIESLIDAAEFFVEKLIPNIPVSLLKKKHAKDQVEVKFSKEKVTVYFEGTAFYWRFVENGTVNIKAQHFVQKTWQQHQKEIERIMTDKIIRRMEG